MTKGIVKIGEPRTREPESERIAIYVCDTRVTDKQAWVPMVAVTFKKLEPGTLYYGLEDIPTVVYEEGENGVGYRHNLTREFIELEWKPKGLAVKLDPPRYYDRGDSFWMTPEGEIYISSHRNPTGDPERILIEKTRQTGNIKAYVIPFQMDKKLGWGQGERMEGPILYVPNRGAVFYKSSLMGDADACGLAVIGTDYFESEELILEQLERGIKGAPLEGDYEGEQFDLSNGIKEIEIAEDTLSKLQISAKTAYQELTKFRHISMEMMMDLEERLGREYINGGEDRLQNDK